MTFLFLSRVISTVGFVGYLPFAPGTFGALAGLIFMVFLKPSPASHAALTVFFIAVGVLSSNHAEKIFGKEDPACVVIDEFAGYIASLLFLPVNWNYMLPAFILFRFFDIIKPPPLKMLEKKLKGGFAIMADDIGAAIYTNLVLQAWRILR